MDYRVRMFCDWDNDSRQLIERLKDQSIYFYGDKYRTGNFIFVDDDSYTHAVYFNYPPGGWNTNRSGLVLMLEPPEIYRAQNDYDVNQWDAYSFAKSPPFKPAYGLGFATCPMKEYPPQRSRPYKACMIVSDKRFTPYHNIRHDVKDALLATDIDLHFYGRGLTGNDPRIKGEIPPMGKKDILPLYDFVIDFENSPLNVVTDKFFDPVICGSVPVTNSKYAYKNLLYSCEYVSFEQPVEKIAVRIQHIVNRMGPYGYDLRGAREAIASGKWSLATWIWEKITNGTARS